MGSKAGKLVDRLRGIYTVPVNDGAGLLNGKDTFTQTFPVGPIQHEAAGKIERLEHFLQSMIDLAECESEAMDPNTELYAVLTAAKLELADKDLTSP
jgi:hypothetical protein